MDGLAQLLCFGERKVRGQPQLGDEVPAKRDRIGGPCDTDVTHHPPPSVGAGARAIAASIASSKSRNCLVPSLLCSYVHAIRRTAASSRAACFSASIARSRQRSRSLSSHARV